MSESFVHEQIIQAGSSDFASKQAEEAVIGTMLMKPRLAEENITALTESDFYYADHGKVYRGIQAVIADQQAVDLITVDAALSKLYPMDMQTLPSVLTGCAHMYIKYSGRNIRDYIKIVKDLSTRRRSIRSFEGIVALLRDPSRDVSEILEQACMESGRIVDGRDRWENIQDVLLATYEYLEKRQQGQIKSITTGIGNIDSLIGGFFGGELTVIGARPSVGKSAFGANIALAAAREGFRVAVASCEMTDVQYGARMISHDSWVDGMKLRKGDVDAEDWRRIAESAGNLGSLPIDFMFNARAVEDLVTEVQRKAARGEIDMLVVDYLQLMETRRRFEKDHARVGYISTSLKHLATDCNIPVIALAQVNRDTDGQMPTLKNLKDSGDIEQDADGVIFLHRPSKPTDPYIDRRDVDMFDVYAQKGLTYLCIGVAKQRQGATGKACVLFDPSIMRYIEIDRREGRP